MTQSMITEQMSHLLNQLTSGNQKSAPTIETVTANSELATNTSGKSVTPAITNVRELKLELNSEENNEQEFNQAELLKTLLSSLKPEDFSENMDAFQDNASE